MKYKKVMALFFSAALSVNILSGCSILPGTVYGMEAAIGNTGEGETDGAKRGSPADTQESNEGSAGRTLSAAEEEGTVLEQTAASEEAGSEAQPSDEGVPPSGQEEVAPPVQETGSGRNKQVQKHLRRSLSRKQPRRTLKGRNQAEHRLNRQVSCRE